MPVMEVTAYPPTVYLSANELPMRYNFSMRLKVAAQCLIHMWTLCTRAQSNAAANLLGSIITSLLRRQVKHCEQNEKIMTPMADTICTLVVISRFRLSLIHI